MSLASGRLNAKPCSCLMGLQLEVGSGRDFRIAAGAHPSAEGAQSDAASIPPVVGGPR